MATQKMKETSVVIHDWSPDHELATAFLTLCPEAKGYINSTKVMVPSKTILEDRTIIDISKEGDTTTLVFIGSQGNNAASLTFAGATVKAECRYGSGVDDFFAFGLAIDRVKSKQP